MLPPAYQQSQADWLLHLQGGVPWLCGFQHAAVHPWQCRTYQDTDQTQQGGRGEGAGAAAVQTSEGETENKTQSVCCDCSVFPYW